MGKVVINISGGVNQIIPNADKVTQTIFTEDGKTVIINQIKTKK